MELRSLINKKGQIAGAFLAILLFVIISFVIVVICGLFLYMGSRIQSELLASNIANKSYRNDETNYSSVINEHMGNLNQSYASLRWISFFLITGMIMMIIIGCYMTPSKPVLFVPYIIMVAIVVIIAVGISNGYEMILDADVDTQETFQSMKGTNWIILNLPLTTAVVGILGGIIMAANFLRYQGDYGYGY